MGTEFDRHCQEVLHATSLQDLSKRMAAFSEDRGFWRFSATVVTEHSPTLREHQYFTNASADYLPEFEDIVAAHVDPVTQHAFVKSTPLAWDQSHYVQGGQASLWERQAPWGYRSGIVVGFHLPRGRHFLFVPDCDRPNCGTPDQIKRLTEDIVLFGYHAQAAACELCLHLDPPDHERVHPTSRELEVLRWTMDGMTRWEVGAKMGLSEPEVARRLKRVLAKLGCTTTYEAVLRAIKLGLIECE